MSVSKIVKYSTSWCNPCKVLKATLVNFTRVPVEEIDCDEDVESASKANIRNVPTLLFLDSEGNVLERTVGLQTLDQINAIIDKYETN